MLLDFISTLAAMAQGYNEQNPIMKYVVESPLLFFTVKAVSVIIIVLMLNYAHKITPVSAIYGMRIICIMMMIVVGGNVYMITAKGESGNIEVNDERVAGYELGSAGGSNHNNFSELIFDTPDFTDIEEVTVRQHSGTTWTFVNQFESSRFVCRLPQTCLGVMVVNSETKNVSYIFDPGFTHINSTSAVNGIISFDFSNPSIISNITTANGGFQGFTDPTSVYPVKQRTVGGYESYSSYYAHVRLQNTDTYNVTYAQGFFNMSVNKSGLVSSKYRIESFSDFYFNESDFSKNDLINVIFLYGNGLYLNQTLSSGSFKKQLINSSNCAACSSESAQMHVYPNSGANIYFDKSTYVMGDNVLINWLIANSTFNSWFSSCQAHIFMNDERKQIVDISSTNETYNFQTSTTGTLRTDILCGVISDSVVGTGSVGISAPSVSYLSMNATQFSRVPFVVNYHIGYSLVGYTNTWIRVDITDSSTGNNVDSLTGISTNDGSLTAQSTRAYAAGRYSVRLYDARKDKVLDTKTIDVIFVPDLIPVINVSTSKISMDRTFYYINDFAYISYAVDSANYTNFSTMIQVINVDTGEVTKQYKNSVASQDSEFQTIINTKDGMRCESGNICYFGVGTNSIRLMSYNSTMSKVLAWVNISVSATTLDGWGLILSSNNITTTEKLTMRVVLPDAATGILRIRDAGYGLNNTNIYQTQVSSGNRTYQASISRVNVNGVGYYDVQLVDSNGNIKMHVPLTVNKASSTTTSTMTGTNQGLTIVSSGWFWTAILCIVFLIAGGTYGGIPGAIGGFSFAVVFSWLGGLIPNVALYLFAMIVILMVAAVMVFGASKSGGGE